MPAPQEQPRSVESNPGRSVMPTLGFFGATASDCLRLALPAPIAELKLFLDSGSAEFLNLRGVRFFKAGSPLTLEPGRLQVDAGSAQGVCERMAPQPLLEMGGYHSSLVKQPWWRVCLEPPLEADEVRIYNRADRWGSRTAGLCVDVVDASGTPRSLYQGHGVQAVQVVEEALASLDVVLPTPPMRDDPTAASAWRIEVVARIAGLLRAKADAIPRHAWRGLIQLVDFWSPRVPSDDELTLVAGYLVAQRKQQHSTSLRAFSAILGSRRSLDRLGGELADIARVEGADPLLLTRHGLSAAGKLVGRVPEVLDHLHEVMDILETRGGSPMLAYGTLLGAVRGEAFIPHDDDVDVLFFASSTNREDVAAEMAELGQALRGAGYPQVAHVPGSLNLHVFNPVTGAMVDVFPFWETGEGVHLHMESMKVRALPAKVFRPRSVARLHGRLFPAPGMPEAFLQERYGEAWKAPDPYFEWPWTLAEDENEQS